MYVELRDGESQEALLKRFQRSVQNAGLLREYKRRRFFVSNGEKARMDARRAAARHRRRAARAAGTLIRRGPGTAPGRGPGTGPGRPTGFSTR